MVSIVDELNIDYTKTIDINAGLQKQEVVDTKNLKESTENGD